MQAIRQTAMSRFGKGRTSFPDGAISWCYAVVVWQEAHIWTLSYGCAGGKGVDWVQAVQREIIQHGHADREVVGMVGSHSGWSWLIDATGERVILAESQQKASPD